MKAGIYLSISLAVRSLPPPPTGLRRAHERACSSARPPQPPTTMARGSNPLERTSVQLMLGVALIALCANSAVDRTDDGTAAPL